MSQHVAEAIRQLRRASAMRALSEGHPIHASSADSAWQAVATLLGDQDRVTLAFVGGAVSCEGEPIEGEDEVTRDLANRWWGQGICGLTIERGLTKAELDILLDMSAGAADGLDIKAIQGRLQAIGATHLAPTETDYERFVPESRLPEDGMSEGAFASTVGIALAGEDSLPAGEAREETRPNVLPVAGRRATEAERAARRAEIAPELERAFGEAVWADRAVVSLELLMLSDSPHLQSAAAADTKLALRRTPEDLKPDVWVHVALELGRLLDPGAYASDAQREAARTVISDTADVDLVTALVDFLPLAGADEHAALFRALALSGEVGRAVLAGLLVDRDGALVEGDLAGIVQVLLESEEGDRGGGPELSLALTNPDCWARAEGLRLVAERGTEASEAVIRHIVRHGDQRLRWDTVHMLGQTLGRGRQALEIALEDPDDYIACAAATHLGSSGDPRAAAALTGRLRASRDTEDRFPLRLTLVQALGEVPCAEATEALAEVLRTRTFFDRRNNDVLRTAAAEGLMRFGTASALSHLAAHAEPERCARIRNLAARAAQTSEAQSEGRSDTDAA